jgi:hypothetical protein
MSASGWIGVDLDGTLAVYNGWNGGGIGDPVPAMADRVREWLAQGVDVRIFTARIASTGMVNGSGQADDAPFVAEQRRLIQDWTERHFGVRLPVTATKDFAMVELWDDRAVSVEANTGRDLRATSQG